MVSSQDANPSQFVGQVINGKYRIQSVLGEGGFGIVYKAELLLFDTGNVFALKVLHPALSQDRTFRRRFLREAGLAMSLIHENTIQIREFGQTEDGQLFFTMDFCEGEPLKGVILRERYLTVNRALHIVRQILSVLRMAHARGIVHRDIKPENIFLERDPQGRDFVKVGDFGLAKSFCGPDDGGGRGTGRTSGPQGEDITRGGIVGTPRYMSPEQAQGRDDIDDRSDLYSLGVVLYEMLYGVVPSDRRSPESPDPRLQTPPDGSPHPVPRAVWDVVRRSVEWAREDRYQNAAEFLAAIDGLPQYTPTYTEPSVPSTGQRRRFALLLAAVSAIGILAAGLYAGWEILSRGEPGQGKDFLVLDPTPAGSGVASETGEAGKITGQTEASKVAASRIAGEAGASRAKAAPRTSMLSPPWPEGIRSFVRLAPGDILRYQTYREGLIPDREVVYQVTEEIAPDRFTVSVTPGDRTVTWVIDPKDNAFYQEFRLPDPDTGELGEPTQKLRLRLPGSSAVVERNYLVLDLKVHAQPVDLSVPPSALQRRGLLFRECICVESREGDRIRCEYFQEGRGLVAIIVFAPKETVRAAQKGIPGGSGVDAEFKPPTPPIDSAAGESRRDAAADRYAIAYASFLVERLPAD